MEMLWILFLLKKQYLKTRDNGNIIKVYDFELADSANLMKSIIFNPPKENKEHAVLVNVLLAKELKKQGTSIMRTMRMVRNLLQVLKS